MSEKFRMQRGSGNVFRDIGYPQEQAENLLLRTQLMSKIRAATKDATQAEAARLFGVTQPRMSDLLRGRVDKFSLDALVNMLAKVGMRVEMRVRKAA
jgi:predicted XRE-type DNA-binding protein